MKHATPVPPILPLDFATSPATLYRRNLKRAFDILVVVLAAPVWVPLVLVLGLLVMLDGGTPFYSQLRVGRGGRSFRMWKLRSMVPGADGLLEHYLSSDPAIRAEWDLRQKLDHDPRITRIGRLIRKTSLDELPQFWNILTGDMSLVGPRPMMLEQRALYSGRAYYALRPGVTGPWQVSTRNEASFADRARYDEQYLHDCSLTVDLALVLRTVLVVLTARGK